MPDQELYTTSEDGCRCPIHATGSPRTVPNGIDFAHRVSVAEIDQREAREHSFMVSGGDVVEVARICIGVPFHNLASCALATSMDQFVHSEVSRLDVEWLLTFIRADHTGSMLRALCDKGWDLVGMSEPRQAGNRPDTGIREWPKQRWLCHIPEAPVPEPEPGVDAPPELTAD